MIIVSPSTLRKLYMTKKVRIENADTASFKLRVITQDKNTEGQWVDAVGNSPTYLDYPAQLAEFYVTSTRRFIVEEYTEA